MKIVIIVPTYNERENIVPLMTKLKEQFRHIAHDMHILVVDDNSPDGTGEVVRKETEYNKNVHLLSGSKMGLGAAYIRGMRYALGELKADVVFEIDADLSHKPSDVPQMVAALEDGADFVIGSRYVVGGSLPVEWGLLRRLISKVGNIVARYLAGMYKIRDCTAGFRAIRASLLKCIDLGNLRVQGYAFQVALLHRALMLGAKVREIPVDFIDRTHGKSKLGLSDIVEFIINAWWIRLQSSRTFIKFVIVGASGIVVNLGFFTLFIEQGLSKFLASPIAIELSIISNFLLNNYWTFQWRQAGDSVHVKGLKFNAVSILSLGLSYGMFVGLSIMYPKAVPQVHQLLSIAPALLTNYFLNSYWTFKKGANVVGHHAEERQKDDNGNRFGRKLDTLELPDLTLKLSDRESSRL
ncbi:MAG: glycosyltransferase family 2 protein [Nitrospinae bacterium]|nr:glycosyltransferase family 2 protein [Nitrospinota bacterium]